MRILREGAIKIVQWAAGEKIDLRPLFSMPKELRPTEFHVKDDGSTSDMPSLAIVMSDLGRPVVYGQVSYEMLKPVIAELRRAEARQLAKASKAVEKQEVPAITPIHGRPPESSNST